MSNFSFSHCVFKRLVLQTRKNQGLFGKGLRCIAVENFARKGEIACNNQFLLFSQCFLSNTVLIFHFRKMDKWGYNYLLEKKIIVRKRETACNEQFLLFPKCFQKQSVYDLLTLHSIDTHFNEKKKDDDF